MYGDPLVHPQPEDYWGNVNPIGPRGVYDEAKRFAEAMTMAYHRTHDLDVRIVRIFNTYGPRMRPDDGRVVTNFIVQALRGDPLTLYGDGSQTRSFCYVDDQIDGQLALFESSYVGPDEHRQPRRVHGRPVRRPRSRDHRVEVAGRVPAAAAGRSRCNASPTSRWRVRCSGGNPRSMCGRGSPAPSTGSAGISRADRSFCYALTVDVTLDLAADALVVATLAIAAGAFAQAVAGLGFSLVCAPVMVLVLGPAIGVRLVNMCSVGVSSVGLVTHRAHVDVRAASGCSSPPS